MASIPIRGAWQQIQERISMAVSLAFDLITDIGCSQPRASIRTSGAVVISDEVLDPESSHKPADLYEVVALTHPLHAVIETRHKSVYKLCSYFESRARHAIGGMTRIERRTHCIASFGTRRGTPSIFLTLMVYIHRERRYGSWNRACLTCGGMAE